MTVRRLVVALALLVVAPACAGSDQRLVPPDLPPHELDDLAAIFDPIVAPLGYEVTRGSLIVRSTYVVDPGGDHLALYLAPLTGLSDDEYAADLPRIAAVLIPMVFERWSGLSSFDVCQEPFGATEQTPPSLTIVDLDRDAAASVEWEGIDLAGLIEAGRSVDGLAVWARTGVRDSTTWTDAAGD